MISVQRLYNLLLKFSVIYDENGQEINPLPENVPLTVYCKGGNSGDEGFAENLTSDKLGIAAFIAKSWILQSDLDELLKQQDTAKPKPKKIAKKVLIDSLDAEMVAAAICGIESEETEEIDEALFDKFNIDLQQFQGILEALFDRIDLGISPLTESAMIGFSEKKGNRGTWLAKKEITGEFISTVLQWLGADEIKPGERGMKREVTNDGKIEYIITVTGPDPSPWISVKDKKKPKDGQLCLITKMDKEGKKFPDCSFEELTFLTKYYADKEEFTEYPTKSNRGIPHWGVEYWQPISKQL